VGYAPGPSSGRHGSTEHDGRCGQGCCVELLPDVGGLRLGLRDGEYLTFGGADLPIGGLGPRMKEQMEMWQGKCTG
jgi:hypothetical protein